MNYNILAVDVKHVSVYDFLQDGETEQELLNRANAYKQGNFETYSDLCFLYPDREDFQKCLKEAKEKEYKVMSWDEFSKLKRDFYLNDPVRETTEQVFYDMLNILPPLKWCTIDGVEMFCMSEMYTGTYTNQYARYNDKYYTKMVDVTDKSTWINNYIGKLKFRQIK